MNDLQQLVSIEIAKWLKDIGYKNYCSYFYALEPYFEQEIMDKFPGFYFDEIKLELEDEANKLIKYKYELKYSPNYINENGKNSFAAPNIYDTVNWIRDNLNIIISVKPIVDGNELYYTYATYYLNGNKTIDYISVSKENYVNYEQAVIRAIENIMQNNHQ